MASPAAPRLRAWASSLPHEGPKALPQTGLPQLIQPLQASQRLRGLLTSNSYARKQTPVLLPSLWWRHCSIPKLFCGSWAPTLPSPPLGLSSAAVLGRPGVFTPDQDSHRARGPLFPPIHPLAFKPFCLITQVQQDTDPALWELSLSPTNPSPHPEHNTPRLPHTSAPNKFQIKRKMLENNWKTLSATVFIKQECLERDVKF